MNTHAQKRVHNLLRQYDRVTLATCGQAGVQVSIVSIQISGLQLRLFLPHRSDHLFNLETHPALVLLSPAWKLHGHGTRNERTQQQTSGQSIVFIKLIRLHVFDTDGQHTIETIDF